MTNIRRAFRMAVLPGHHEEYARRHAPIWTDLEGVLKTHGAHNYSIFLDSADGSLFAYVEIEDEARWSAIASTLACQLWWAHMSDIMPVNADKSPKSVTLTEVFHLD